MSGYSKYAVRKSGIFLCLVLFSGFILLLSKSICAQGYWPMSLSWDFYDTGEYNPYLNWGFSDMGRQASSLYNWGSWGMDTQRTTDFYNSGQNYEIASKPVLPSFTKMEDYWILTEDISGYYYPPPGVAQASTGFAPVPYQVVPSSTNIYWTFSYDEKGNRIGGMGGSINPPIKEAPKSYEEQWDEYWSQFPKDNNSDYWDGYRTPPRDPETGGQLF